MDCGGQKWSIGDIADHFWPLAIHIGCAREKNIPHNLRHDLMIAHSVFCANVKTAMRNTQIGRFLEFFWLLQSGILAKRSLRILKRLRPIWGGWCHVL